MTRPEALNIVRPLPLTVDDFFLLDRSGAFEGYGKTELINGEIYFMNAQHRPHIMAKMDLFLALHDCLEKIDSEYRSVTEGTINAGEHNAPEPGIILTSEAYGEGPIPVSSVGMIVEISDTTLQYDKTTKQGVYASAGVPEYWIYDLKAQIIHQMWSPEGTGYIRSRQIPAGDIIVAETISGLTIHLPA